MKIYSVVKKGELHPVYCEDFLVSTYVGECYYLGAVLDGCSSGEDSHFASALMGKLLKKIGKDISQQERLLFENPPLSAEDIAIKMLKKMFWELRDARKHLGLTNVEILSTLILMVYDENQKQAFIIAIGDGMVAIDGKVTEIDQDNMPDYMAYHLNHSFDQWFQKQEHIYRVNNPQEISIATDGVDTFRSHKTDNPADFNPVDFLLLDNSLDTTQNMLTRKTNILHKKYGYLPADDISIIRVKF